MLKGGLGNQLFQFGAALRLARGDITNIRIYEGLTGTNKFRFAEIFPLESLPGSISELQFQEIIKKGEAKLIGDVNDNPYINQSLLDLEIDLTRQDIVLNGYFQTGRHLQQLAYFKDRLGGISQCPIMRGRPDEIGNQLLVHIRLGDYRRSDVQQKIGAINFGYFDKVISEEISNGNRVIICSDEPKTVRSFFTSNQIDVCEENDDMAVFHKFLSAKKMVIPNSTFSLCAAYLSEKINVLIRPARWTRNLTKDELLFGFRGDVKTVANSFFGI